MSKIANWKKVLTCLFAATVAAGSLSACGGGGAGGGTATVNMEGTPTTGEKNAYGWEMPKETLKFNIFTVGQSSPDDLKKYNDKLRAYILEKFNVDLNFIVYDTNPDERLNLMLSSGDYPECIRSLNNVQLQKFVSMKKALPLDDLINTTTALKARYEKYKPYITNEQDGKIYNLMVQCGGADESTKIPCADTSPMLRLDWYEEIGSPDISTPELYKAALEQMVANHPTTVSGKKTYGLSFYDTKSSGITPSFVSWFGGMFGLRQGWDIADDNSLELWINSPKGEKLIKYLNSLSIDGLFDPEGFISTVEQWGEKGVDEQYAGYVGPWFQPAYYISDNWMKLEGDTYQSNKRYVHYNVRDTEIEKSTFNPQSAKSSAVILTDKCKNPADYMRWFDFEHTDNGIKLTGYGMPNEEASIWTFDEATGEGKITQEAIDAITAEKSQFDFDPYMQLGGECQMVITGTTEKMADGNNCWLNQSYKDKWKVIKDENMAESFYNNTALSSIILQPENPLTAKRQRCADIIMTGYAQAILAKTPEECETILNNTREEAKASGLDEVVKFYSDEHKKYAERYGIKY